MVEWIERLGQIVLSGDFQGVFLNILGDSMDSLVEREKIISNIKKFVSLQNDDIVSGQLEEILNKMKPQIIKGIRSRKLDILDVIEKQLDEQMEICEIGIDSRNVIKENLKYFILFAIRESDRDFYNDLLLNRGLQEMVLNDLNQDNKIDNIILQIQELRTFIGELKVNKESPVKVKSKIPHINDANKIIERTVEIELIECMFKQGSNIIFLFGRPGMGKTTLAKLYAKKSGLKYVYIEKYEKSFENTIKKLLKEPKELEEKDIIDYWIYHPDEAKNTLLIIDNFNEDILQGSDKKRYTNELQSKFFKRLIDVGVHIIITTRINVERNVIEVGPVNRPLKLFEEYCGSVLKEEDKKVAEKLIQVVHCNTLLIILLAQIWKRSSGNRGDEILIKLQNCSVRENDLKIPGYIDSDDIEERTLYEQVNVILDFGGVLKESNIVKLLANITLLPLEGIEKIDFLELMEQENDNELLQLINGAWVITDGITICMHPLIREILLNKQIITYEQCKIYCENIGEKIAISQQFENRIRYKKYAEEIYKIFSYEKIQDVELARLFYSLSDIYDELGERELSTKVADLIIENIELYANNPIEKARVLSGIAYSWNNNYIDIQTLDRADKILADAYNSLISMNSGKEQFDYIEAFGKVLSNRGSNCLAKSRYNEKMKNKYLQEAIYWHKKALDYRKDKIWSCTENDEMEKRIKLNIATSYTTLATDYYDMKEFEKSIETHLEALKIRKELGNQKGVTVNQQRIIGCVISMYCERFELDGTYVDLILEYYPELLKLNYEHQNKKSLEQNLLYFTQLRTIILNDRRLECKIREVKNVCDEILCWCNTIPELKDKHLKLEE